MSLIMKFGGTSLGNADAIRRAADLIKESHQRWTALVVVCSAMSGVTDQLLEGARTAASGNASTYKELSQDIRKRHYRVVAELLSGTEVAQEVTAAIDRFVDRYESLCKAVLVLGELTPRALDAMTSVGERLSIRIMAGYLQTCGEPAEAIDATEIMVTDDTFQNATPLLDETRVKAEKRLGPLLERGTIAIITGFIGATAGGVTTTLGRGGSDFSAAILGQVLEATEVWIWTDVDGVMTADPRLVPTAKTISSLSYREVAELAFYGAKVLHPKTIRPVIENNIPLRIKNSFNPGDRGTLITREVSENNGKVKAVTAVQKLSMVNIEGKGMLGVPGIAARTFATVARSQINVLLISQASSEQSICFAVPEDSTDLIVNALEDEFKEELTRRDIDQIWAQRSVSIVTVVGAGMRGTPGISGRLFTALGDRRVNIIAIAQGSSECSISMVVTDEDTREAECAIHDLIVQPW